MDLIGSIFDPKTTQIDDSVPEAERGLMFKSRNLFIVA